MGRAPIIGKMIVVMAATLMAKEGLAAPETMGSAEVPSFIHPARMLRSAATSDFVQLRGRRVDPVARRDAKGRAVDMKDAATAVNDQLRLIQLTGPLDEQTAAQLRNSGAKVVGYLPDNTLIVRVSDARMAETHAFAGVRWMGNYAPFYRQSARLVKAAQRPMPPGYDRLLTVRVFLIPDCDVSAALRSAQSLGSAGLIWSDDSGSVLEVSVLEAKLEILAAIPGVLMLDYAPQPKIQNNIAADILENRSFWNLTGFYGSNEIVAVADSGLDVCSNSTVNVHADFLDAAGVPRVVFLQDYSGDGAHDPISGHGTHVAGSVLGNGLLSGGDPTNHLYPTNCFAGSAPEARLVFQAMGRSTNSSALYPPANLNTLFKAAYTNGARVHQNSWGSDTYGDYTTQSRQVDEFAFYNPEMLICYSAGNAGMDGDSNGVVDLGSLGSPATAKNCLTVGASENARSNFTGTWGGFWPSDFPSNPIAGDRVANREDGMAGFSGRGPCGDGRLKPDLVAPGTYIGSVRSHAIASGTSILWGNMAGTTSYCWSGGTSMSSPLVSGAAALLREYLQRQRGLTNPPAALLKAILLNGAFDMSPGQYGSDAFKEISTAPNNVEGWGRLALESSVHGSPGFALSYINGWDNPMTNDDMSLTTQFTVHDSNLPLRVHLVWQDFPGSTFTFDSNYLYAVGGGLMNDLDLKLTDPDGVNHLALARDQRVNLFYYTNNTSLSWYSSTGLLQAELCRAPELPLTLTHIEQIVYDTNTLGGDFATYVWAGTETGGAPQEVLFSVTNSIPAGGGLWYLDVPVNLTITTRYFHIGSGQLEGSHVRQPRDPGSSSLRSGYSSGGVWTFPDPSGDLWIHAFGGALTNDHVNNVEGVILNNPAKGVWTLHVTAANAPRPPVRFAVALSGALEASSNTPPEAPVLLSPTNCPDVGMDGAISNDDIALYGRLLNPRPRLIWKMPVDADGDRLHFQVFSDTTNASLSLASSSNDTTGFEYFNGLKWEAFPAAGAASTNSAARIRYKPEFDLDLSTGHYWRVMAWDSLTNSPSSSTRRFVLGGRTWTDPSLTGRVTRVRAVQMEEIQEECNYARISRGYPTNAWTSIVPGITPVRAAYFTNLFSAIAEVTNQTGESVVPYPSITPKITTVSTNHLQLLRRTLTDI
ncbi:MAG: S8 family serine peptidase [Lentisphaerota bacterium]